MSTDYDDGKIVEFCKWADPFIRPDSGRAGVNAARVEHDANVGPDNTAPKIPMGYAASILKHERELLAELQIEHPNPLPTPVPHGAIGPPPSRYQILGGQFTLQGLRVTIDGVVFPWWSACWAWLTQDQRRQAAPQLLNAGERIILIEYPDGRALYDEGGQFYSPDKFPPFFMQPSDFVDLVGESLGYGFPAAWIFWGGDGSAAESIQQALDITPMLGSRLGVNLNDYALQVPGWDGTWHKPKAGSGTGYSPSDFAEFARVARAAGAKHLGAEHGTGYMLAGGGRGNYAPGGVMAGYDLILGEFDDEQLDVDDCWQILARYLGPAYVRPANEPAADDPAAPFGLHDGRFNFAETSERGPFLYRAFEHMLYGDVRGRYTPERVLANKRRLEAMGCTNVC